MEEKKTYSIGFEFNDGNGYTYGVVKDPDGNPVCKTHDKNVLRRVADHHGLTIEWPEGADFGPDGKVEVNEVRVDLVEWTKEGPIVRDPDGGVFLAPFEKCNIGLR
jgi:hypothetical protein